MKRVRRQFDCYPLFDALDVQEAIACPWRARPVAAMGLPPATVRQLQHWGLTTAGAVAVVLDAGGRIGGLNTEANLQLEDAIDVLTEGEPTPRPSARPRFGPAS